MYVSIPELGVWVMFSGLIFSVEVPFSKFANNTEGQCGECPAPTPHPPGSGLCPRSFSVAECVRHEKGSPWVCPRSHTLGPGLRPLHGAEPTGNSAFWLYQECVTTGPRAWPHSPHPRPTPVVLPGNGPRVWLLGGKRKHTEVEGQVRTLHQGPPGDARPAPRLGDAEPLAAGRRPPDCRPHAAGTCTNDQKDECRLPGGEVVASCSDMSSHWKVAYPGQPPCNGPPPTPTPVEPRTSPTPCPPSPICQLILSK